MVRNPYTEFHFAQSTTLLWSIATYMYMTLARARLDLRKDLPIKGGTM